MSTQSPAFRTVFRLLVTCSALYLMWLVTIQVFPPSRSKAKPATDQVAEQLEAELVSSELNGPEPIPDSIVTEISGSVVGNDASQSDPFFSEEPSDQHAATIEVDRADHRVVISNSNSTRDTKLTSITNSQTLLPEIDQRLRDFESRQADRDAERNRQFLELLQAQTSNLNAIRERMDTLEHHLEELQAASTETAATEAADITESPNILIKTELVDGVQKLEIEGRDASLAQLLARLGEVAGVNLLVSPEITGVVSLHLSLLEPREALETVCRIHHCTIQQEGAIYVVSPIPVKETEDTKPALVNPVTKLYHLKHLSGSEIRPYIAPMLTPALGKVSFASIRERVGRTTYRSPPRAVIVMDSAEVIDKVDRLIMELDRPPVDGLPLPNLANSYGHSSKAPIRRQSYDQTVPMMPPPLQATGPALPIPLPEPLPETSVEGTAPNGDADIFLPPIER